MSNTSDEFTDLLSNALDDLGLSMSEHKENVRQYVAYQMAELALAVGEPGYDEAVLATRDNIILKIGLLTSEAANVSNARIIGLVQGALFFGAKVISGGAL